jgi:hypothetical protein
MLEDFFLLYTFLSLSESLLKRRCHSQYWRETEKVKILFKNLFFYFSQKEKGQGENLENKKRENKRRIMLNWVWAWGDDSTR